MNLPPLPAASSIHDFMHDTPVYSYADIVTYGRTCARAVSTITQAEFMALVYRLVDNAKAYRQGDEVINAVADLKAALTQAGIV